MATPEDYGIDAKAIVEQLAAQEGISIETPHRVTPGTAKLLAMRAILQAFEQLSTPEKPSLPAWDSIVLTSDKDASEIAQLSGSDEAANSVPRVRSRVPMPSFPAEPKGDEI